MEDHSTPTALRTSPRRQKLRLLIQQRQVRLVSTTVGVTGVASAISFVVSTILLRVLPLADAGRFALLATLIETILLIGGLGQSSLIIRLYSQQPLGHYNWPRDLSLLTLITLPAIVGMSLVAVHVYALETLAAGYLIVAALAASSILCIAQMLNSQRHYQWGNVLQRFPNNLMLLPAVVIFFVLPLRRLDLMLVFQLIAYLLTVGISLFLLQRKTSRGSATIGFRQLGQGLVFLASVSSTVVADQVLLSVAGINVSTGDFAAFAALSMPFNTIQLLQNVFSKVLVTEFAREKETNYKKTILRMGLICALLVTAMTLLMPLVTHWIYAGRYDWAFFLIGWLGLANGLDLAEVIPRSYLFGCASSRLLNWFSLTQVLIAAFGLGIGIILIQQYGIVGIALGAVIIFVLRLASSYGFFLKSLPAK